MFKRILILLVLFIQAAFSQKIIEEKLAAKLNNSELILRAKLESKQSKWISDKRGKHIYTIGNFSILEVVKGSLADQKIILEIPGGTVNDTTEFVSNSISLGSNSEMILLLSRSRITQSLRIDEKINIINNRVYLQSKFVNAQNFISYLKSSFQTNIAIPENLTEIEKRVDVLEMKTNRIDRTNLKNLNQKKLNAAGIFTNLAPYKPLNWSAEVVVSKVKGDNTDAASMNETDILYIDWAAANYGPDDITGTVLFSLYVDNTLYAQWQANGFSSGYYVFVSDFEIEPLSQGIHSISLVVDPNNSITETNETDNAYLKNITVDAVAGLPTISSISPSTSSAGTGSTVIITGNNFGTIRGTGQVEFFYKYGEPKIESSRYVSWSNTRIECEVPIGIINDYPASTSSGPVTVKTTTGRSIGYNLDIFFGYGDVKWSGNPALVPLKINPNTTDISNADDEVISAAGTWTSSGANFGFNYNGVSNLTDASSDGINQIVWGSTENSLATAYYWSVGNNMIEADIVFNDSYNWSRDGSAVDVQSIALHELGHWLSLRDLYGGNDVNKVMYGFASSGAIKRSLTSGEVDGIKWIYGNGSAPLSAPLLSSPVNSTINSPLNQLLKWSRVIGVGAVYRIQVSNNANFTNPVIDVTNLNGTQYQTSNLTSNTKYYWRAMASNSANGSSNWSDVWNFTTEKQFFTVTCLTNPAQGGTATGSGTFSEGTTVTLTATPASGYYFVNWSEGSNIVSTTAIFTFNISSNKTYTANFNLIPVISVIQPNGGETWRVATQQEIKWSSINVVNVKIDYSFDNGNSWINVANQIAAADGKYIWDMPNTPSQNVKIKISDAANSNINDQSDNTFTISPIPFITLVSPNGGENWNRSSQQEIKWNSAGIQNVKIEYTTNNGSSWLTIINSTPAADGKYNWTLPFIQTKEVKIRITDISSSTLTDISDNAFIIGPLPTLTLVSPNGGENWLAGLEYVIKWGGAYLNSLKIEYSTDNGLTWIELSNSAASQNGNFTWLIPNIKSATVKIRLTDTSDLTNDVSDNPFTILEAPRGDIDGDNKLGDTDGLLLLRSIVGLEELNTRQKYSADADRNGLIQAYDAFFILFYLFFGAWPQ